MLPHPSNTHLNVLKNFLPDPTYPLRFKFKGPIYQSFLEQVHRRPNAWALVSGQDFYTYAELDEISGRVAGYLRMRGIGQGHTVMLFSNRNPAMIYAILGVLKCGAAFFVADAAYPAARLLDCCSLINSTIALVCGEITLPASLEKARGNGFTLNLPSSKGDAFQFLAPYDPLTQLVEVNEKDPAYISFTSGTTGLPKAIITSHAPLPHFLEWHTKTHELHQNDRFSLLSGLSHDPVLRDIFTPLSIGASLHIPDQTTIFDPLQLSSWITEQEISIIHLTPSLGQIIVTRAQDGPPLRHIRYFFWGGDLLSYKLSQTIHHIAPNAQQVNFYGATETPQAMSYFPINSMWKEPHCPLGKGIADTQLLVMKNTGELASINEVGEIFIRTPYLSQGYFNDPKQTEIRFVANPFTNDTNDRCYKTGDLGKYLDNGDVVFIGRSDLQVKIRGYRIELEEVIAKIELHPGIARAIVLAQDIGRESKVLYAYYTCEASRIVNKEDLLEYLRKTLPPYMIPSFIVPLDSFPLLPNGKINLSALSSLPQMIDTPDHTITPLTNRESEMVKLWESILGIKNISIHKSFTDLGGDSLSALQVLLSMLRLGIPEVLASGVLQGKTISQIALEEQRGYAEHKTPTSMSFGAQMSLLINFLRGILVIALVTSHWLHSLVKLLPWSLNSLQYYLEPIFNIATPGFALAFGLSLGYSFYPKYKIHPGNVRKKLIFGISLLGIGLSLGALLNFAIFAARGEALKLANPWLMPIEPVPYGVLLYYFFALLTAPLIFRFISLFRYEITASLCLMAASYFVYQLCLKFLLGLELTGLALLIDLMLISKYAYFNMSLGTLGGMAIGIYLSRLHKGDKLTNQLLSGGVFLLVWGLAQLFFSTGNLDGLYNGDDMRLWRWLFYSGALLIFASGLNVLISRYEQLPSVVQKTLNLGGVVGQCAFLIFVLHFLVVQIKLLLDTTLLPEKVTLLLPLPIFVIVCGWAMSKIYYLQYGSISKSRAE